VPAYTWLNIREFKSLALARPGDNIREFKSRALARPGDNIR
jgi:hypothetical protein